MLQNPCLEWPATPSSGRWKPAKLEDPSFYENTMAISMMKGHVEDSYESTGPDSYHAPGTHAQSGVQFLRCSLQLFRFPKGVHAEKFDDLGYP